MSGRQVIERVWDAPIALIWELWTSKEGIASWYGPKGFTVEVHTLELRVGGSYHYTMRASSPEMAAAMEAKGRPASGSVNAVFTEVDAPNRLAWDSPWGPDKLMTAVTFEQVESSVKMTLVIDATKPEMTGGAAMGWKSSLERFAEQLTG